jgi:hypothetical protein
VSTPTVSEPSSLVVHIGPRKTGTTAIQHALQARREDLRQYGVVYPGTGKQHFPAVNRFLGRRQNWELDVEAEIEERPWRRLLRDIGNAPRGIISTEVLSQARVEHVQRIHDSVPARTLTVVITYRPFEEILSSTWQQLVKEGMRESLAEWSRAEVVGHPELSSAPFPRILDLATLVDIWGGVVGFENIAIVLVDPRQPHAIFEAFAELLGLPRTLLVTDAKEGRKRSLSAQEVELLRQTNALLPRDTTALAQHRAFRLRVAAWLSKHPPNPADTRLSTPADVIELARVRSQQMVDYLLSLPVRPQIFGDLHTLVPTTPIAPDEAQPPSTVAVSTAAHLLASAIRLVGDEASAPQRPTGG